MSYDDQVGGRSKIVRFLGNHLLKPTKVREAMNYINMDKSILDVSPDCCFVILNGEITSMKKCSTCSLLSSKAEIETLTAKNPSESFIIMKDAAYGMEQPRILDIKLGTRTHSDDISEERKIKRLLKIKTTTSFSLGLRLCGATFYEKDGTLVKWNREDAKKKTAEEFVGVMKAFFDTVSLSKKASISHQLLKIKTVIQANEGVRVFGSSLLILIDDNSDSAKVKLIDFANMSRPEHGEIQYAGVDNGAVFGLNSLLGILYN